MVKCKTTHKYVNMLQMETLTQVFIIHFFVNVKKLVNNCRHEQKKKHNFLKTN